MSSCKSCGAPVTWVRTKRGNQMPLDTVPVVDGNLVVDGNVCRQFDAEVDADKERFKSHFATCPSADQYRKLVMTRGKA